MEPPGQPREFICERCQGRFSSLEALQQHMHNCNGFTGEFEMISDDRGQSSRHEQPDPFEIVYADPVFDNVHQFFIPPGELHQRTHLGENDDGYINHGIYLKDIDNLANGEELDKYLGRGASFRRDRDHAAGSEKDYNCSHCGLGFITELKLRVHMQTHDDEEEAYASGDNVSQPNAVASSKGTQGPEKPYVCDICGRGYFYSHTLSRHIRARHTAEKPHVCDRCGKGFSERYILVNHIRTHTNEKPYECKVCQTSFSEKSNLQRHVKNKHPVETRHKCTVCDQSLTDNEALLSHMRTHDSKKPYECTVC